MSFQHRLPQRAGEVRRWFLECSQLGIRRKVLRCGREVIRELPTNPRNSCKQVGNACW